MVTLEDRLDELLALATDAGRLGAEYQALDKACQDALDRPKARRLAREARKAWEIAERRVGAMRARFLGVEVTPRVTCQDSPESTKFQSTPVEESAVTCEACAPGHPLGSLRNPCLAHGCECWCNR